jgi:F-type H+-transporting ATPase subunit a
MSVEHAAEETGSMGQRVGNFILEHVFMNHQYDTLFGIDISGLSISKNVLMMLIASVLLIIMGILVRSRLQLVPRGFTNLVESFVLFIKRDVAEATMGHQAAEKYTPYLCTTFFFILTCNLLGLVPYGSSATGYVSITASLAFMSFLIIQYAGIRKLGIGGYLKHLIPPGVPWWLSPIMFLVELMGVFAKPFALCIRLFANMVAGHVVIISLIGLIFVMSFWVFPVSVAFCVFMYLLELFVAFLQAYIFTMLTSLFMGLLVAGEH